ncbi:LAGLIDADG family homing endonuclease, partial [Palleronia sp.]|uniref:LAGLIDADG family homing endonuclease n=1 Tax=Palleronia sp. TaxID=1940284 RepID=UPI0035C7D1CA
VGAFKCVPSMRALMTAGAALDRCSVPAFNCSYVPADSLEAFDEAMYILLCGTGVGYSVERQSVDMLPAVPANLVECGDVILVDDSKEGWAKSLNQLLRYLFNGQIPQWNTSRVRKKGARLKTFGGRASGPEPLEKLLKFTVETFKRAQGRKLRPIECHDLMCMIGDIVVVGGVRRSAMISLSDLDDAAMANAKGQFEVKSLEQIRADLHRVGILNAYGEIELHDVTLKGWDLEEARAGRAGWWVAYPHRALANNSAVYEEKPGRELFDKEWAALVASQSGERGIFSRAAAIAQVNKTGIRSSYNPKTKKDYAYGTNPCCVTGETPILTKQGYVPIIETVGKDVEIWNGEDWAPVVPYEAGEGDILRVLLSDGTRLNCTPNHRFCIAGKGFVTAEDLVVGDKLEKFTMPVVEAGWAYDGDAYSQGFYSADGNKNREFSWVYAPKYVCIDRLVGKFRDTDYGRKFWQHGEMKSKGFVPVNGTLDYCLNWLAGLLDGDGTALRYTNGVGAQLASVDYDFLSDVRLMLTRLGVQAKIGTTHPEGTNRKFDGYDCHPCYRLCINCSDLAQLSALGLKLERLDVSDNAPQRDARRFVTVVDVKDLDRVEMTYCFTEPKTSRGTFNGIVTGNSEIILRPYSFCNLSEVIVRAEDTLEDLAMKVWAATVLGTMQSTLTDYTYLRPIWKQNAEEERLLGVSLTGIMDHPVLSGREGRERREGWLKELNGIARGTNKALAEEIGIPSSDAICCVKPSGTVSQLTNTASGIHTRHSPFYIRTVRGDNKDPITAFMKDAGIPNEPCVMKGETTTIFSFPMKAPEGAVTRHDLSAVEQLENWLDFQRYWCDHKPSCTVSVRNEEWAEVADWVYAHFDEISGVSFLPQTDHTYQQAPYQDCDEEAYEAMKAIMPTTVNWSALALYEKEDTTIAMQQLACTAGVCEI